jgi:hypothetical protein
MKGKLITALLALLFAASLWYLFSLPPPPNTKESITQTDDAVNSVTDSIADFKPTLIEHKTETERRVVTIRASTIAEARDLPPDALVSGVLDELELFRRTAGDYDKTGSSGLAGY